MSPRAKGEKMAMPSGSAAAAMIASGIGTLVIGVMTSAAEASAALKDALNWWNPAGPLSGKTGVGIIVWLLSWAILNGLWKDKEYLLSRAFQITILLLVLGLLLTFPPIFELFVAE